MGAWANIERRDVWVSTDVLPVERGGSGVGDNLRVYFFRVVIGILSMPVWKKRRKR